MDFRDAKTFIGKDVLVAWLDRKGAEQSKIVQVFEVNFVPMYGPCLVTDAGNIQLERIVRCALHVAAAA